MKYSVTISFLISLLLSSTTAMAQVQVANTTCIGERGANSCTANDEEGFTATVINVESPCIGGSAVVDLAVSVPGSNAQTRYDVGTAVSQVGQDAKDDALCTIRVPGASNPGAVDADDDACLDRGPNQELTYDIQDVTIACPEELGEPVIVGICTFWRQNDQEVCNSANDAGPGTGSKCLCGAVEVGTSPLPVELTSFTGEVDRGAITLRWATATEKNNAGFAVEHAYRSEFREVGFVTGKGTTLEESRYSYALSDLNPGKHRFRLKQVDYDGTSKYSAELELTVGVPGKFLLEAAYPNPFNPQTTINFLVPEAQEVQMELYSVLGMHVRTLLSGEVEANTTETVQIDGSGLPSGVYIVRLTGRNFTASQQIVLMK